MKERKAQIKMSQEFYINHTTKNIEITWKGRKNQIWKVILSLIIPLIFIFVIMLQAKMIWAKVCQNADPMLIKAHCTHTFPALWGDRGFFRARIISLSIKVCSSRSFSSTSKSFLWKNAVKDIKYFSMGLYFGNLL